MTAGVFVIISYNLIINYKADLTLQLFINQSLVLPLKILRSVLCAAYFLDADSLR